MILYGLSTCDTCRKARRALPDARFVDVRAEGVPRDTLDDALAQFGAALVNRRSTTWRALSEAERDQGADVLLSQHPTLMKRPLIVEGARMTLGWDANVAAEWSQAGDATQG
ncbi:MAG: ArsC/Spx/MgsR family protein [Shimia sp.]